MSLIEVRASIQDLFNDATIRAITPQNYDHELLGGGNSQTEKYYFENEINFFVFLVSKSVQQKLNGAKLETYSIEIKYYREHNLDGSNQNIIKDTFEALMTRRETVLGIDLGDSVDFYRELNRPILIESIQLDGKNCWVGSYTFEGVKTVDA